MVQIGNRNIELNRTDSYSIHNHNYYPYILLCGQFIIVFSLCCYICIISIYVHFVYLETTIYSAGHYVIQ